MAQTALKLKADDMVVLDLRKLSYSFDFFVICSGSSDRRIRSIADEVREGLAAKGVRPGHVEGRQDARWVLLDYGAVVGHLFSPEARSFYRLDHLWADAPRLSVPKLK